MPEQDIESLRVMGWGLEAARKFFRRRRRRRRPLGPGPKGTKSNKKQQKFQCVGSLLSFMVLGWHFLVVLVSKSAKNWYLELISSTFQRPAGPCKNIETPMKY